MENANNFKKERFDSYLNKTIILSSKNYFKKQVNIANKEKNIIDDEDYSAYLQKFIEDGQYFSGFDNVELSLQLENAIQSLTAIEQSVIFFAFSRRINRRRSSYNS